MSQERTASYWVVQTLHNLQIVKRQHLNIGPEKSFGCYLSSKCIMLLHFSLILYLESVSTMAIMWLTVISIVAGYFLLPLPGKYAWVFSFGILKNQLFCHLLSLWGLDSGNSFKSLMKNLARRALSNNSYGLFSL